MDEIIQQMGEFQAHSEVHIIADFWTVFGLIGFPVFRQVPCGSAITADILTQPFHDVSADL